MGADVTDNLPFIIDAACLTALRVVGLLQLVNDTVAPDDCPLLAVFVTAADDLGFGVDSISDAVFFRRSMFPNRSFYL